MKFKPISPSRLRTYSLKTRKSKVSVHDFAMPVRQGKSFNDFLNSLPNILAVKNLKEVAAAVVKAHSSKRPVAVGIGAHVIKVGLSPVIIDLMEMGVINAVAMNGACIVHDFEIAFAGMTSEDVDAEIGKGSFGKATGEGSERDFKLFAGVVANLEGGVYLNIGSAVLLPEVFLKALTLVRNLGYKVRNFTTVNMDFIQHYRSLTNVVRRPTKESGKGYTLTGHHEIMVPLLAAVVKEGLNE